MLTKKYIAGISGGPDSMAMLDMYKTKIGSVCTVNYQKRIDSQIDVDIVKNYCLLNNIDFYLLEVTDEMYNSYKSNNFQDVARKIRYNFFLETSIKTNLNNLLIAHNLDDHIETAFMQFSKKSKSLFYGIHKKSNYQTLKILRPLIKLRKSTLERYCKTNNIDYAIDSSNSEPIYKRNEIRILISKWKSDDLLFFIKRINDYNNSNKSLVKEIKELEEKWKKTDFDVLFFKKISNKDIQYYLIYNFLKGYDINKISYSKILNIIDFIQSTSFKKYRLEDNKFIFLKNNKISIF